MSVKNYRRMHNEELIDMLFTEEDRLPRAAADEIIRRGQEMVTTLAEIAMDRLVWAAEVPDWWAPVHATYLLGSIGGSGAITPLMAALRWSDAYDNEWVTEDLPSMLGSLGELSWPHIVSAAKEGAAGWSARSIAMDAMGSQSLRFPAREEEAMGLLGSILKDLSEEHGARRSAAFVLLDFRRADFRRELISFAKEEGDRQKQYPEYRAAFTAEDVEQDLASPRIGMDIYIRDWLEFYDPSEIRKRQERWAGEDGRSRPGEGPQVSRIGRQASVIALDDPCPCGSGRSYKRCCLRKLH
ncbi:MAG: SEC-C domain-containing protein [Pseudomonadota bacterium]